ncbi:hypothetical protein FGO68_gene7324 [Halteria grandinella]|uniref:Uncharacterized protein n=1 Tax=Halteria grandinella TaxID=5974 RepID=A0A8J8NKM3_HALGN|nr:hypothetical protein FGO68_gene7324 [Halteria grandinella]
MWLWRCLKNTFWREAEYIGISKAQPGDRVAVEGYAKCGDNYSLDQQHIYAKERILTFGPRATSGDTSGHSKILDDPYGFRNRLPRQQMDEIENAIRGMKLEKEEVVKEYLNPFSILQLSGQVIFKTSKLNLSNIAQYKKSGYKVEMRMKGDTIHLVETVSLPVGQYLRVTFRAPKVKEMFHSLWTTIVKPDPSGLAFEEPSFWGRNKFYIVGAIILGSIVAMGYLKIFDKRRNARGNNQPQDGNNGP